MRADAPTFMPVMGEVQHRNLRVLEIFGAFLCLSGKYRSDCSRILKYLNAVRMMATSSRRLPR